MTDRNCMRVEDNPVFTGMSVQELAETLSNIHIDPNFGIMPGAEQEIGYFAIAEAIRRLMLLNATPDKCRPDKQKGYKLVEKNYTRVTLCEAIEKAHGKITTPFSLRYPSDPRCQYSLRIHVGCNGWDMFWYTAENEENIAELLGIPKDNIIFFEWDSYGDNVLHLIVREETDDHTEEQCQN